MPHSHDTHPAPRTGWRVLAGALLLGLAAGVAGLPAHAAQPAPGCPAPSADTPALREEVRRGHVVRFRERLATIDAALAGPRADVIMLGDSLVQQWPQAEAERLFRGRRVLNAGVSGDTTGALLFRLSGAETPAVIEGERLRIGIRNWGRQQPGTVLLLIGTNNLRSGSACDIAAGIGAVVQRVRGLWSSSEVLVLGVLPRGERQEDEAEKIVALNALLAAMAPARGFRFLETRGALDCPDGGAACGFTRPPNHVHLSPRGYAALVDRLGETANFYPR